MRMPISTRRPVLGAFVVVCCMARVGAQGQAPPQPTTLEGAASHVYKSINGIDLRLNDATVPYADVEQYCASAVKHGNQCDVIGYDGATHGFFNQRNADGKWYRETLLEADRFLTRIGYLSSPSPTQIQR